MRSFFYASIICGFAVMSGAAFAGSSTASAPVPVSCAACGKKAPAPEMGASIVGLAMAGAMAFYVLRRRRNSQA